MKIYSASALLFAWLCIYCEWRWSEREMKKGEREESQEIDESFGDGSKRDGEEEGGEREVYTWLDVRACKLEP